jgi:hypothetical protein
VHIRFSLPKKFCQKKKRLVEDLYGFRTSLVPCVNRTILQVQFRKKKCEGLAICTSCTQSQRFVDGHVHCTF